MKITQIMIALLLVSSLAAPAVARDQIHKHAARAQTQAIWGREVTAPPWSAACMTDHGPSECGEPMWIYGSSGDRATR